MLKKHYSVPVILSHQGIHFETVHCTLGSACQDGDKDGGYVNGVYVENEKSPDSN